VNNSGGITFNQSGSLNTAILLKLNAQVQINLTPSGMLIDIN
jgi:hypothetical protein